LKLDVPCHMNFTMSGVSNEILNLFGSAFDENDFE
jgi:hypothetical protein